MKRVLCVVLSVSFAVPMFAAVSGPSTSSATAAPETIGAGQTKTFGTVTISVDDGSATFKRGESGWEIKIDKPGSKVTITDSDDGTPEKPGTVTVTGSNSTVTVHGDGNTVNNESNDSTVNVDGDDNSVNVNGDNNSTNLGGDTVEGDPSTGNSGSYGPNANGNTIGSNNPGGSGNSWTDAGGNKFPW